MLAQTNRIKEKIQTGHIPFGFICRTLSPAIVEIIGLAGFDFVWIDMEHSTADFSTVEHLCRAADAVEMESLVRVPDKHPSSVLRALEAGAGIVNVPQVETAEEAAAVVNAAKYAPVGQRGFCNSSRGTRYGFSGSVEETFAAANERVVVMAQIESVRGVQNAEAICSVPGLDIVFVGSADLSQSLGVVGQFDHPLVLESTRQVLRAARACGKTTMMLVESVEKARPWLDEGTRIFCCGVDIPVFGKTLLRVREAFDPLGARRD